ncbi:unnamed protein product [Chondrus crispus]|uniref:Uncharacterized protein n=1 Tax=Chondrus crispus TaxID=2769 RepID=R7QDK6_CHOCR|nr:unnamed protein product [Chondrus crispus]CDF35863.1 unnamed protein product [Chondrus crispus]|eukprot:XP_005715682.1 unnamed protein product [Chondrus crispus]
MVVALHRSSFLSRYKIMRDMRAARVSQAAPSSCHVGDFPRSATVWYKIVYYTCTVRSQRPSLHHHGVISFGPSSRAGPGRASSSPRAPPAPALKRDRRQTRRGP